MRTGEARTVKRAPSNVVFLFDVDNTLIFNDQIIADLEEYLSAEVGAGRAGLLEILRGVARGAGLRRLSRRPATLSRRLSARVAPALRFAVPHQLSVRQPAFSAGARCPGPLPTVGAGGAALGRRCCFSAAQGGSSGLSEAVGGRVMIYVHRNWNCPTWPALFPPAITLWWTTSSASWPP